MARQDPRDDSCKNKSVQIAMILSVFLYWMVIYTAEYVKAVVAVFS